jgi:flagellar biosynthesis component FlhA
MILSYKQFINESNNNYKDLIVLSYNEIIPGIEIRSLGMIGLE